MASAGVPVTDCLPPELLETIVSFMDVRTLCTARLVCAQFRDAASKCIHSVEISAKTLRSRSETTLNNFPNLSRVSVFDVVGADLLMLAHSPVAAALTHLRADECFWRVPPPAQCIPGFPQQPFPKLTSLTVGHSHNGPSLFLPTLRELCIKVDVSCLHTAKLVAGMTNLTSLTIDVHNMMRPFKAVTALTALQRLEICGDMYLIPLVAELTLLTHLHLMHTRRCGDELSDLVLLASLSRLRRLEHLGFRHFLHTGDSMERQVLASAATLTGFRSLDLRVCRRPDRSAFETVCMAPFDRLTALRLESDDLDASFLPRFSLERLRDLRLSRGVELDRDGVAALGRATYLARLQVWTETVGGIVGHEEWEVALSRMSRLRDLSLGATGKFEATGPLQAIALLTELTRLDLNGRGVTTTAGGKLCLGLKKLHVLGIWVSYFRPAPFERISPETFYALAKLPELCKFDLVGTVGISDLGPEEDVRARINAERDDKGWPPLELTVSAQRYRSDYR